MARRAAAVPGLSPPPASTSVAPGCVRRAANGADVDPVNTPRRSAADRPLDAHPWLEECLHAMGCRRRGRKWQCPAHGHTGEHSAALAVGTRDDGCGAWLRCHAGCPRRAVLRALALHPGHLRRPPPLSPAQWVAIHELRRDWPQLRPGAASSPAAAGYRHEAFHSYGPDHRKERLRRPSDGAKTLRWEARNPAGEWVPGLLGAREVDLPLYRESELQIAAAAGETVVLCESESSCDALRGVYATTWAGGASSIPAATLVRALSGVDLVVVPDHDAAGLACLHRLAVLLPHARVLLGAPGEDARDLYRRVGLAGFTELLRTAHATD